jgi:phosphohistidine phosphatase
MLKLTLFRHGKSGWDSPVARDFDRPINDRGARGAKLMGAHVCGLGLNWDYVLSSPAVRCTETLDSLWEGYGRILHPNWDRRIYLASGATLLDVIQELDAGAKSVIMCGHNPGLEDLALMLVPDVKGDALRDALEMKFPTASLAELSFDVSTWGDIKEGSAKLTRFIRPRDLDPTLGPEVD